MLILKSSRSIGISLLSIKVTPFAQPDVRVAAVSGISIGRFTSISSSFHRISILSEHHADCSSPLSCQRSPYERLKPTISSFTIVGVHSKLRTSLLFEKSFSLFSEATSSDVSEDNPLRY